MVTLVSDAPGALRSVPDFVHHARGGGAKSERRRFTTKSGRGRLVLCPKLHAELRAQDQTRGLDGGHRCPPPSRQSRLGSPGGLASPLCALGFLQEITNPGDWPRVDAGLELDLDIPPRARIPPRLDEVWSGQALSGEVVFRGLEIIVRRNFDVLPGVSPRGGRPRKRDGLAAACRFEGQAGPVNLIERARAGTIACRHDSTVRLFS